MLPLGIFHESLGLMYHCGIQLDSKGYGHGSDLGALERMPVNSELNHPRLKIPFRYLFLQDSSPTKAHRGHLAKQVATVLRSCKRLSFQLSKKYL
jgi:hypothetical protein